jgi:hypothetical protein
VDCFFLGTLSLPPNNIFIYWPLFKSQVSSISTTFIKECYLIYRTLTNNTYRFYFVKSFFTLYTELPPIIHIDSTLSSLCLPYIQRISFLSAVVINSKMLNLEQNGIFVWWITNRMKSSTKVIWPLTLINFELSSLSLPYIQNFHQ